MFGYSLLNFISIRNKIILLCFLCLPYIVFSQKVNKIEIIKANSLEYDESLGKGIRKLIGGVVLKHEEALMYCDSAYMSQDDNSFIAFSNIHMTQGDTMHLYGDTLYYSGNTKLARVRHNVRLINNEGAILTTHFLNYNRHEKLAHYFNHGKIVDNDNILTSISGYYHTNTKDFFSIDSVTLVNPEYIMYSDTLKYNTATEIAYFFGPTEIISDSSYIYCENGWYNTITDISQYNENAYMRNKAHTLKGDSLYYDKRIKL